jgi:hypothetical protein
MAAILNRAVDFVIITDISSPPTSNNKMVEYKKRSADLDYGSIRGRLRFVFNNSFIYGINSKAGLMLSREIPRHN